MTSTVFISYSSHDRSIAEELERELERLGVAVLRDKSIMRGGGDWETQILGLVENTEKFVVLWSYAATESLPVAMELTRALSRKVEITSLRLDDAPASPLLKNVHEFDGRIGLDKILDAFSPSVAQTNFTGQQSAAVIRSYRRLLGEEVAHFPVLLNHRDYSTKHVIRLSVTDELVNDEHDDPAVRRLDILSMLHESPGEFTLLIGHPGSGKTTSARYLVQHLLEEAGLSSPRFLPFPAHCRQFNPKKYGSILKFIYTQVGHLLNFQISEALEARNLAQQPGAILIMDGFDELPSGTADAFLEQLGSLREEPEFRGSHVLLTSRFDAYRQFEKYFAGWRKLALAPLSRTQITAFIQHWFENDDAIASDLSEQINEPRLAELAIRPFLLAMMCLVRENGGDLGRNRSELYFKAIAYLERRQSSTISASVRTLRRQVLETLSMRMLQLGESDIDRWTAAGVTAAVISAANGRVPAQFDDCTAFLDSLAREIGITQAMLDHYSFVHRTFMEYLAACKLNDMGNGTAVAVEHCTVARWEEPIRLYTGMQTASVKQVEIVKQLWREHPALALRTLTDARTVDRSVVESLIADSDSTERVRMLRTLRSSFRDVDRRTRLRLVLETTEPLLTNETDNEVVYNAVSLLRWVDPDDRTRTLWRAFGFDAALKRQQLLDNPSMSFSFIAISGGVFTMGDDLAIDTIEKPAHQVTVNDFKINRYQVTNLAYELVTGRSPDQRHPVSSRDKQPVVGLNWFDSYVFALRIGCRLPTEAEWEYAARAGSTTAWCFGEDLAQLPEYANFEEEGHAKSEPWDVGSGRPNAFGLHDMHGNAWEWCADWLGAYNIEEARDPKGPETGVVRVRRGGGFAYHSRGCRSAFRWGNDPSYRFKDIGVRVILDEPAVIHGW
jgi:sulfatase modifying factor 1